MEAEGALVMGVYAAGPGNVAVEKHCTGKLDGSSSCGGHEAAAAVVAGKSVNDGFDDSWSIAEAVAERRAVNPPLDRQ